MLKKKSPLKATRLHQRKRRTRIILGSIFLIACILILSGFSWLSRVSALSIQTVKVHGNVAIDATDISSIAEKNISGAYVALFSKSNKLLYPKDSIETEIRTTFPSIDSLHIETNGNELEIDLSERKPAYMWCSGKPQDIERACYFMDETGYIFSVAPEFSGNAYFIFYGGIEEGKNPIGTTFYIPEELQEIQAFKDSLKDEGINISSLFEKAENIREVYFSDRGKIIFKKTQDLTDVVSSLHLLKTKTDLFTHSTSSIEYIDFRYGNKVYYKFIGDNPVQTPE
jgi:cell division septal protein FtsQ